MPNRASAEAVATVLRKVLPEGQLNRIPRHPEHRNIILAMLCRGMQRRHAYAEIEFNEFLKSALLQFRAQVDHVTCRRYMVDFGFVKRDRAGNRYFLNYPKLESSLTEEAIASAGDLLEMTIADCGRSSRGKQHGRS